MFTLWLEYFIIFFFLLLPHFYPLLLSPLSQSSHSSFLLVANFNSSTCCRPKPLPSANNTDWSLRFLPLSLCYLIFPLLCLSIFLRLKHQDLWSPVLGFDFVAVIDKTALSPWLSFMLMGSIFILMNEFRFCWWLINGVCWWLMNGGWVSLVDEWWWRWWWFWLMVEVVVVGAMDVLWVVRYIILL